MNHYSYNKGKKELEPKSSKPKHVHRRTMSKNSEELEKTFKISTQKCPMQIKPAKCKPSEALFEDSLDCHLDEESIILQIIEQRKVLSPLCGTEFTKSKLKCRENAVNSLQLSPKNEKKVCTASSTALTVNEENNFEKIVNILENKCLSGTKNQILRQNIVNLMQKSPEPYYALLMDESLHLRGIYYVEITSGYLHRILGDDCTPLIISPPKIKRFLSYDDHKKRFFLSSISQFDAIVMK